MQTQDLQKFLEKKATVDVVDASLLEEFEEWMESAPESEDNLETLFTSFLHVRRTKLEAENNPK